MNVETLQQIVHGMIHEGKQIPDAGDRVILTVKQIGRLTRKGTLDFGGSEYSGAAVEWLQPQKKTADDRYGWWELDAGDYLVEYNESLTPVSDLRCYLQVWDQAEHAGISQPCQVVSQRRDTLTALIHVAGTGVGIKENARLSVLGVL